MKTISIFFVYLAFFCSLFAGANVLVSLGYSHSFFGKYISNPTVYFFVFAFVLSSLNNCMKYKIEVRTFLCLLMAAVCSMFVNGADFPRNTLFPSLMLPALVSIILSKLGKNLNKEVFKKIFYVYFFVECIVAIIERILGFCFFPDLGFETGFNEMGFEGFRSFSLRGHPLANGAVVSLMISFILVSKASLVNKNCMTLLGIIALLCFNARFAIVITCGFYAIYIYKVLRKSKVQTKIFYLLVIFIVYYFFLLLLHKVTTSGCGIRPSFHSS